MSSLYGKLLSCRRVIGYDPDKIGYRDENKIENRCDCGMEMKLKTEIKRKVKVRWRK